MEKLPSRSRRQFKSIDDAFSEFDEEAKRTFSALSKFPAIGLNITGGLDSRLILANALRAKLATELIYGVGNSGMTNTRVEDLEVARIISETFNLKLHVMDWKQTKIYTKKERLKLCDRFGFQQLYGSTSGVINSLEMHEGPLPILQIGGYNPAFTNIKIWEKNYAEYSIDTLIKIMMKDYQNLFSLSEDGYSLRASLRSDLFAMAGSLGFDPLKLTQHEFMHLFFEQRKALESVNPISFNGFIYYVAPFYTTELYDILTSLEPAWRTHDHFQLKATQLVQPSVLDIPIYSGLKRYRFDTDNFTMTALKKERALTGALKALHDPIKDMLRPMKDMLRSLRHRSGKDGVTDHFRCETYKALSGNMTAPKLKYDVFQHKYLPRFYNALLMIEIAEQFKK
jgi:hypothetical protein